MPINVLPNDPMALNGSPMRQQEPRPDRGPAEAGFTFDPHPAATVANPGTPAFLFWQCREAALTAVAVWEGIDGPIEGWARARPSRRRLALHQNEGQDLNAYYDGQSCSFFEFTTGSKTTFSGASTDVVAHEVGHALLDHIRPDLWDSNFIEVGAFHEGFGDCLALMTALSDRATRDALLAVSADLGQANFLEATAEDLSDGVRRALGPNHPAAAPRHALNRFKWQLPSTLPSTGKPPVLTSEVHSFARIISGCFYDVVRNLFATMPVHDQAALAAATKTAGQLLIAGARRAPEVPRFLRAVGRTMVLADEALNGGANRLAIRNAFARHGLALGSAALVSPTAALEGPPPRVTAGTRSVLSPATRRDLLRRISAPDDARMEMRAVDIAGEQLMSATYRRPVELDAVHPQLRGVVAFASEATLLGASGTRAAVVGAFPQPSVTRDEVHAFVRTLVDNGQVELGGRGAAARARAVSPASTPSGWSAQRPTHAVRARGGARVLTRVRFACGAY